VFANGTALMFFAHTVAELYIYRFITGIGAGGEYGVAIALIADNFDRKQLGRMSSIGAIGGQTGAILAAVLAAVILPSFGWRALFLFGLVPVILTFFIRKHVKETDEFKANQGRDAKLKAKVSISSLFATPKLTGLTLRLVVMVIVQIAGYFGLMNWLPSMMQAKLGLSVSGSSIWMIATIVGMSLGMVTFGHILDFFGPRRAFGIFLLLAAISVYGLAMVQTELMLLFVAAVVGFFSNGMFGGYGAIISQLYPSEIRVTANNFIVSIGRAIGGFSAVVIGIIMDHYDLTMVMVFLSVLYVISLFTMLSIGALKKLTVK
jgi:MFS family permease